jgi:hypothetical protein
MMYNFIKNLVSPKKPAPSIMAFNRIPAWVKEQEKKARETLEEAAKAPMQSIRNSAAQLQLVVNSISGSEHDPALHPKLKSVAKNSLPLYIKAMNAALAKPLSADLEEFYTDAVECVKSSLNTNRGQGRYLQAVFPDEMKAVKTSIDAMGREMNGLTSSLAVYRKQRAAIEEVKDLYQSVHDMQDDLKLSGEKEQRITVRIGEITSRIAEIEAEETRLASDEEGKQAIETCRAILAEREKTRNDVTRNYAARSMTASHVFRKAENIAAKQHHPGEVSALKHAIEILSNHDMPDPSVLGTALAAACPVAQQMITAGDIPLKNREEREVFSDTDLFCSTMSELCTELMACDKTCRDAETTLSTHPLVVRTNSLMREKTQLGHRLTKEEQLHHELVLWTAKITEKIPVTTEELREKIEGIIGGSVQFQPDTN